LRRENTVFWSWQVFEKVGGEIRKVGVSLYLLLHRLAYGNKIVDRATVLHLPSERLMLLSNRPVLLSPSK
jgi:hypothetical protein